MKSLIQPLNSILLFAFFLSISCDSEDASSNPMPNPNNNSTGQTGSLARFSIIQDFLFAIDQVDEWETKLKSFNIQRPEQPGELDTYRTEVVGETLFAQDNLLYMAGRNGMSIYQVMENGSLKLRSDVFHPTGCDPVVVKGSYAYVTIRGGFSCSGNLDELQVYDISDPSYPFQVYSYQLKGPKGLGIDGNRLIVCDKDEVVVFDLEVPSKPIPYPNAIPLRANDVIVRSDRLIFTSELGISQYTFNENKETYVSRSIAYF
jgi:hypothetical protein